MKHLPNANLTKVSIPSPTESRRVGWHGLPEQIAAPERERELIEAFSRAVRAGVFKEVVRDPKFVAFEKSDYHFVDWIRGKAHGRSSVSASDCRQIKSAKRAARTVLDVQTDPTDEERDYVMKLRGGCGCNHPNAAAPCNNCCDEYSDEEAAEALEECGQINAGTTCKASGDKHVALGAPAPDAEWSAWIPCSAEMPDFPAKDYRLRHRITKVETPTNGNYSLRHNANEDCRPNFEYCHKLPTKPRFLIGDLVRDVKGLHGILCVVRIGEVFINCIKNDHEPPIGFMPNELLLLRQPKAALATEQELRGEV